MPRYGLLTIFALRALLSFGAAFADFRVAFVFPVSVTVCGRVVQNLIVRTKDTVIIFVVHIFVRFEISFFAHWPFVRKDWNPAVIQNLFANIRDLVTGIGNDILDFRENSFYLVIYTFEHYTVMNICGGKLHPEDGIVPIGAGLDMNNRPQIQLTQADDTVFYRMNFAVISLPVCFLLRANFR